ncbi:MAG: YidC/Oxa1 family membrane protein insertase [Lachnospiraceae bacterium]|nr:YidC/Oxa1 family membrane protein insertase [Lachnospiraceae bacterium]
MNLFSILYDIIIAPIEYIIEMIFCFVFFNFNSFGVLGAIIGISLAVNILALPLYLKADELQLAERKTQQKMEDRVNRIKKAFRGDEQFMMLSEYYKRNDYHPLYAVRSALSIMIEIPFFIAAYQFLSHCSILEGYGQWIFEDLSKPDGLLTLPFAGGITINVLPILMTLINFVSTAVYTKGAPFREKAQAYILALVFLVILYASPCGLVFYWILNNLFSMFKNVVMQMKKPVYAIYVIYALGVIMLIGMNVFFAVHPERLATTKKVVLVWLTIIWTLLPALKIALTKITGFIQKICMGNATGAGKTGATPLMVSACIALWFLAGLLLPSSVIATSPTEFSFMGSVDSPVSYILSNFTFYFGLFVFWPVCIFKMFQKKVQNLFPVLFFGAAFCAVFNIYLFKSEFGNVTTVFEPENRELYVSSSYSFVWTALLPMVLAGVLLLLAYRYNKLQLLTMAAVILTLTAGILSVKNIADVKGEYEVYARYLEERQTDDSEGELETQFSLTRTGNNVIVLFCDRFASAYFPYLLEQFPELRDSYEGFTYYPNCISFATNTLLGAPAMMGGYEYTPMQMNQREGRLVDLHNESTMVLPVYFDNLGYDVKVVDPPHVNYVWESDYTPFEAYPDIEVCSLINNYKERYEQEYREDYTNVDYGEIGTKNCRLYALTQMLYPPLRNVVGGNGRYYTTDNYAYYEQSYFLRDYAYAFYMPQLTDAENDNDTYTFIEWEITHEYQMLLAPDYRSGMPTEEHPYAGIGSYPENPAIVDPELNIQSYHVNACAILMIADYLDALKEMGVYDNTRIIIVSDHGSVIPTAPFWEMESLPFAANFNPMLLVKDFNSTGEVQTDWTFVTNADTPYLATEGLGAEQVNPFTGQPFALSAPGAVYDVFDGKVSDATFDLEATEFTFYHHFTIRDNIFEEANWTDEGTY